MVTPGATDLDALAWGEVRRFPVYFSLDAVSAQQLGFTGADILVTSSIGGPPTLYRSGASVGLLPGDDVDAQAVDATGNIVFSLSRTSPSILAGGSLAGLGGPATLFRSVAGSSQVTPWASASQLGLDYATDNVNGIRIADTQNIVAMDGAELDPVTGHPHNTISIDQSGCNARHTVDVAMGQPFDFAVNPQQPTRVALLFGVIGRPCAYDWVKVPQTPGRLAFVAGTVGTFLLQPVVGPYVIPNNVITQQVEVTFQGVVYDPVTWARDTTNLVTLWVY